jgi:hypothetical protein
LLLGKRRRNTQYEQGREQEKLGFTESGQKRNWVEGQKGKVDQQSFLKTAR